MYAKITLYYFRMLVGASAFLLALAAPARADLIVTGGAATVTAGGNGTVDFTIQTNSGDMLSAFGLQLQITVQTGGSFLQFSNSQPTPYTNPNYVFAGDSFGQAFSLPFWGSPATTTTSNDTIAGGDSSNSGNAYAVSSTGTGPDSYLATVQFQAPGGAAVGDSWSIALVPSSGTGSGNTYLSDQNGTPLSFTSTAAHITLSPAATPEPSSFVLTALGGAGLWFYRRRLRRMRAPKPPEPGVPSCPLAS
jgi:hypothetical protein